MKICYLTIAVIALIGIVIGSALMIMSPSNRKNVSQTNDNAEENTFETTLPQTEHETQEFAKQLYVLQTPYIGDASADWAILNTIMEYYGITSYESMELHTETEPYGISLHFGSAPDEIAMQNMAILFLALVENCERVYWDYETDGVLEIYGVSLADANTILACENMKIYSDSEELLLELVQHLSE